jgi:hypothetical protein
VTESRGDPPPAAIVVEPAPDWAPELERRFPEWDVAALLPEDLSPALASRRAWPPDLLLLAPGAVAGRAALLGGLLERRGARCRVLALLPPNEADSEFLLRELGVASIALTTDHRAQVLAACRRLVRPR